MRTGPRKGLLRAGIAVALGGAAIAACIVKGAEVESFLRWFDFLSAMPGLSGLAILIGAALAVVLVMFTAHWVIAGFSSPTEGSGNTDSG